MVKELKLNVCFNVTSIETCAQSNHSCFTVLTTAYKTRYGLLINGR